MQSLVLGYDGPELSVGYPYVGGFTNLQADFLMLWTMFERIGPLDIRWFEGGLWMQAMSTNPVRVVHGRVQGIDGHPSVVPLYVE